MKDQNDNDTARSAYFTLPACDRPGAFDALEVHTVLQAADFCEAFIAGEAIPEGATVCWSLYGHADGVGLACIGDFDSFDAACETALRLGASPLVP